MNKSQLHEKFKSMSKDDLTQYKIAGITVNRICSLIGISIFLLIFFLDLGIVFYAMSGITLYILAQVAVAGCETAEKAEEYLERYNR
jgi:hypothetical protein